MRDDETIRDVRPEGWLLYTIAEVRKPFTIPPAPSGVMVAAAVIGVVREVWSMPLDAEAA